MFPYSFVISANSSVGNMLLYTSVPSSDKVGKETYAVTDIYAFHHRGLWECNVWTIK